MFRGSKIHGGSRFQSGLQLLIYFLFFLAVSATAIRARRGSSFSLNIFIPFCGKISLGFTRAGYAGRLPFPAKVILVATHADKLSTSRTSNNNNGGAESESADVSVLLATLTKKYYADLNIHPQIIQLDAHVAASPEIKTLRQTIAAMKGDICAVRST